MHPEFNVDVFFERLGSQGVIPEEMKSLFH
jgi:hypothetical protein